MKKCINCGQELEDNAVFCENCGEKQKTQTNTSVIESKWKEIVAASTKFIKDGTDKTKEIAANIINQSDENFVELMNGEKIVRNYECAKESFLFFNVLKGHLLITNKRIIFYGQGPASKRYQETYIDDVSSISSSYGYTANPFFFVIGFAAFFAGILIPKQVLRLIGKTYLKGFLIILGIVLLFLSIRKAIRMHIYAKSSLNSTVGFGLSVNSLANRLLLTYGGTDSEKMISEVGKVILELKEANK